MTKINNDALESYLNRDDIETTIEGGKIVFTHKPKHGYSQGLGAIDFESDDPIRVMFRKAEMFDKIKESVTPPLDGARYGVEIAERYWMIRELIYPEIPQEILV